MNVFEIRVFDIEDVFSVLRIDQGEYIIIKIDIEKLRLRNLIKKLTFYIKNIYISYRL